MTMIDAIFEVLKKAGCPRKVGEIYELMKENHIWNIRKWPTNTPENSIAAALMRDMRKRETRFEKFGGNCFGLKEHKAPSGKKGYVYILSNPSFGSKCVKVGKAESVLERLISLNSAVPKDYEPEYVLVSTAYEVAEKLAHAFLIKDGYHPEDFNDEFFNCTVSDAKKILEKVHKSLPSGDNEIVKWNAGIEVVYGTVKKGKIPKKYEVCLDPVSIAGSSYVGKGKRFCVTLPNNITISEIKSANTFVEVIKFAIKSFGIERVAIILPKRVCKDRSKFPKYANCRELGGGWFLNIHGSTAELAKTLRRLNEELELGIKVKEVH